jgi:hypothetical protein
VLVALAAGAYLFRDTLLGFAGLGGEEENIAQTTPPVRPRSGRLRSRALPPVLPAATPATVAATPEATPVTAHPLDTPALPAAKPAAGPVTEVSAVRPAATPRPAASLPAASTPGQTSKAVAKPPGEKPAPLPAVREDTGPAATGIDKITFEKAFGGTDVIVWGNGAIRASSYVRSRIEGNPPRELIRISGIKRSAPAARLVVGTPEVLQVRTGLHAGDELHVVLDLAGPKVTVTGVEEGENRLRIHLQKQ